MSQPIIGIPVGHLIDGKYRLKEFLGSGSFGAVFRADEEFQGRGITQVAVKLMRRQQGRDGEKQLRELHVARGLQHPGILTCHAVGTTTINGVGYLYMVMELAEESLACHIKQRPLTVEEACEMTRSIAGALAYIHGKSYVHRDVKPENILKVGEIWKLVDFGCARQLQAQSVMNGTYTGTPRYMPPEVVKNEVSPAWDCWSFGVVLLRALGYPFPHEGENEFQLVHNITSQRPRIPSGIPQPYNAIIYGCLRSRTERMTAQQIRTGLNDNGDSKAESSKGYLTPGTSTPGATPIIPVAYRQTQQLTATPEVSSKPVSVNPVSNANTPTTAGNQPLSKIVNWFTESVANGRLNRLYLILFLLCIGCVMYLSSFKLFAPIKNSVPTNKTGNVSWKNGHFVSINDDYTWSIRSIGMPLESNILNLMYSVAQESDYYHCYVKHSNKYLVANSKIIGIEDNYGQIAMRDVNAGSEFPAVTPWYNSTGEHGEIYEVKATINYGVEHLEIRKHMILRSDRYILYLGGNSTVMYIGLYDKTYERTIHQLKFVEENGKLLKKF